MKAPFPYFGGKSMVASVVWNALGDVGHYIEPFCGSCAVLLSRPAFDPTRHVETVVDADGHIANVWRALQKAPDAVAKFCDWPVNHADLIARKKRLNSETASLLESLCADEDYCNPKLAGYYIWAASCWIGDGLICPGQIPDLTDGGMGVHAKGKIPHLAGGGKGVHAKGKIPHLAGGGKGVHAKGKRPHLTRAGMGVHAKDQRPHLTNAGTGVQEPYNTNIYKWFRQLSERLRYVRIVCGDWSRVCGGNWQDGPGRPVGIFFDPPYSDKAQRDNNLYAVDSLTVAHDVREWCRGRADNPDYRIVLAGYYDEHCELLDEGWTVHQWSAAGGYANTGKNINNNRHKESLFLSRYCRNKELPLFRKTGN